MLLNRIVPGATDDKDRKSKGYTSPRYPVGVRSARRRRLCAANRQAQVGRLRLGLIGALLLLIVMTATSYRSTESLIERQTTLNAAYRSHILFVDLDETVRHAQTIAKNESLSQRSECRNSILESRKLLTTLESRPPAPWSSAQERYTDLVPRTKLYLTALEKSLKLRDNGRPQAAAAFLSDSASAYDRLVQLSARLRAEEERDLARFTEEMTEDADRERNKVWLFTSLFLVLLGVVGLYFARDLGARTRQEQELRSANRTLTRLAEQDSLTLLKNRRALEEDLHTEWARARRQRTPLSLLFVDVDKFKEYNDTFGHQAGDEALRKVADLLRQEEKLSGCCVARYGGEEFALVMPQTDKDEARRVGERVRASFEATHWHGRPVTASVGIATLSQKIRGSFGDVETLLYEADGALYHAKREGRNRVAHADDLFPLPPTPSEPAPVRTAAR